MGALLKEFEKAEAAAPNDTGRAEQSLSEAFDAAVKAADSSKKEAAKPKAAPVAEERGKLASFGAGVGAAVGRGAMGVQQIAGKGISTLGGLADMEQVKGAGDWLQADALRGAEKLAGENAPYAAANPKTNLAGEVTGFVASPVNKIIPAGGAATSLAGAVVKGAGQGAALNVLTSPVEGGKDFATEKGRQAVVGALGGAAGGGIGYALGGALNKGLEALKGLSGRLTAGSAAKTAETALDSVLGPGGAAKVAKDRPELFAGLKAQVDDAVRAGKTVDPTAVQRLAQAQTLPVPVPMLKGQITRDPMQFAMEQNLRGIHGTGEPITEVLRSQNKALVENLNALGASKGANVVEAAKPVIETLQAADKAANAQVGQAYKAFKAATGRELDVPLQGLAQDYAKVLSERGSSIPAEVRKAFESYGLLTGKAQKALTITEAEGLIKNYINKNYDASNRVAAGALDELRNAVQKAISDGAGSSAEGTAAAGLAKAAREAASGRFKLIENTPGLKAAIQGAEPDKFLQKFVLQGNEREIGGMMDVLKKQDQKALTALQDSIMTHIKARVTGGATEENAIFSQAALKEFVNNPNMAARLTQVLGPERMATLRQLHRVAEDAIYAPVASTVNRSNTAAAGANLVKSEAQGGAANELLNIGKVIPGSKMLYDITDVQNKVQSGRLADLVNEAVGAAPAKRSAVRLGDLVSPGARAGVAAADERNRKAAQR